MAHLAFETSGASSQSHAEASFPHEAELPPITPRYPRYPLVTPPLLVTPANAQKSFLQAIPWSLNVSAVSSN